MKKFLIKIFVFGALCVMMDQVFGSVADYLVAHAKNGEIAKTYHICETNTDSILVFGTSRACHHYNPRIFEDTLNISCYNCAFDGCGSVLFDGFYKIILQRYKPAYIIYDLAPFADYLVKKEDNSKFLGQLKRYYDYPGIRDIFELVLNSNEDIKMMSRMYRYNSQLLKILIGNVRPDPEYEIGYKGFLPKNEEMIKDVSWSKDSEDKTFEHVFDPVRKSCFDDFVADCHRHGTKLVFCVSPWYKRSTDESLDYAKMVAKKYGIPLINHYTDSTLNTHREYFYDALHLNRKGADLYSSIIAHEIKEYIRQ